MQRHGPGFPPCKEGLKPQLTSPHFKPLTSGTTLLATSIHQKGVPCRSFPQLLCPKQVPWSYRHKGPSSTHANSFSSSPTQELCMCKCYPRINSSYFISGASRLEAQAAGWEGSTTVDSCIPKGVSPVLDILRASAA